jgi:hypothetical protein
VPRDVFRRGHARRLPLRSRLDYLQHFVTKQLVRLKRDQLSVLDARVLKLSPFTDNSRHARQRTAHSFTSLQTPHHDPIPIVIELARSTQLERTKKRDRKRALLDDLQSFFARR